MQSPASNIVALYFILSVQSTPHIIYNPPDILVRQLGGKNHSL